MELAISIQDDIPEDWHIEYKIERKVHLDKLLNNEKATYKGKKMNEKNRELIKTFIESITSKNELSLF